MLPSPAVRHRRLPARASLAAALLPMLAVILGALCIVACGGPETTVPVARPPAPGEMPDEATFLAELDRSRGHRDSFDVIRDPEFVSADAPHGLVSDEMVLGLDLGTAQVAYPINLLNFHENVEHTLAGIDLLVCW